MVRRNALTNFKFLANNTKGIKSKLTTIQRIIEEQQPVMIALVETKLEKNENIQFSGYDSTPVNRDEGCGGVLVAINKSMANIVVSTCEYKQHGSEML